MYQPGISLTVRQIERMLGGFEFGGLRWFGHLCFLERPAVDGVP
jgi:hypothetical protein